MNKNLLSCIYLSLIIILLQACVTVKVASNKDESYTKQPKKIFVLMNAAKQSKEFTRVFLMELQSKLKEKGVETETYERDPLSLETEKDITSKINNYAPDALMVIAQKEVHSTNNMVDGGSFEISLTDGESKKVVWKSELGVVGPYTLGQTASKGLDEFMKKLVEDKIVRP